MKGKVILYGRLAGQVYDLEEKSGIPFPRSRQEWEEFLSGDGGIALIHARTAEHAVRHIAIDCGVTIPDNTLLLPVSEPQIYRRGRLLSAGETAHPAERCPKVAP